MRELIRQNEGVAADFSAASLPADYAAITATPWPALKLGISVHHQAVTSIDFLPGDTPERAAATPLAAEVLRQLQAYFRDPHCGFTLPLAEGGTAFQRRVWTALRRIPAGTTTSYGALARRLGSSPRAVGGACRANPIALVTPCHRVVGQSGIGGFMGVTGGRSLDIKQWLLAHESAS